MSAVGETVRRTAHRSVYRTRVGVGVTIGRRDGLAVLAVVSVGYLLAYLYAVGHLALGTGDVGLLVVDEPLGRAFQAVGAFQYEPVARLDLGAVRVLVSPVNLGIGGVLSGLVGLNFALSYLAWRQPSACGISAGSGPLAALPALLSGAACCGPTLLIVLGVQASGLLLTAFDVLVPVGVLLLLASLLAVGRRIEPAAVATS